MPNVSASWNASLPISLEVTWPVSATTGIESMSASTRPVTRFVAPGPERRAADADPAGGSGISFGGEAGILLVPNQDVPDRMVVHGVIERQRNATGVAENAFHLFVHKALEEHSCSTHQG